ncbi:MAG: DPP IV N-terminal domain-containing protein, partial [Acidobacteria bacterium]|nr:DPP IV N-terminal domain-containing protein [Acidobacteriota bacterium]
MKRFAILSLLVCSAVGSVHAQNKLLTLDDIFNPDASKRVAFGGRPVGVQWAADGRSFKQLINGRLMRVDAATGQAVPYYNSDRLAGELQRFGVKQSDALNIANSPTLHFNADESGILVNAANDLWYFDVASGVLKRLTNNYDAEREADFSPDGKWISFVRGNNLYAIDVAKGGEKQLTRDGREGAKPILNGINDWIYEEELYGRGQKRAYWWSPDSKYIAFLRLDESQVPKWIIPNDIPQDQSVEETFYPQAGDPNPVVRLGIADVARTSVISPARIPKIGEKLPPVLQRLGDSVQFADTSQYKPDDLLIARVAWSPTSRFVSFQ